MTQLLVYPFTHWFYCCTYHGYDGSKFDRVLVDFCCGSEMGGIIPIYLVAEFKEGKCLPSEGSFIFSGQFINFGVEFFYFFFVAVGYVFVDLGVSEMLLYVLFDVDISEHDDGTHIFVCPDRDEFYMIRKVAEG